jgi:hypothetical protein
MTDTKLVRVIWIGAVVILLVGGPLSDSGAAM